ncbi:glycosyltransferase [Lacipirellula parvula]|uniref:Putative hexosyltransferase n=1 Tax=Lacipirellula parvula TaxID=2650471 RepID=A0A5K7XH06_9BACT|nr:glycosyltransferase [Lacipirellula parvula]BBO33513.1 putative hexosyltransferase [Lacipirellula parvula]
METVERSKPLRVLFLLTSMPVGGAETLLVNLVRRLDRKRFAPEIVCLKEPGPLGEMLAAEMPVHHDLLACKYDVRILPRLWSLMRRPQADAVVTVGAGDKMFWGRLAAYLAGVPVVASALHSTGWPDGVGRLNRMLTRITDAFIGVADAHAVHLVQNERFPTAKVNTIYNGVDCERFSPQDATPIRNELGIAADAPVVGILAALRPEKNHELFLHGAAAIRQTLQAAQFIVVGDGPKRNELQMLAKKLGLAEAVHFVGSRSDVPALLAACSVVALTSHNEASPVSILEALACGVPVVASNVGSVRETVVDGVTGRLFAPGDEGAFVGATVELLQNQEEARRLGEEGRRRVEARWSLEAMVRGYEELIERIFVSKQVAKLAPALATDDDEGPSTLPFLTGVLPRRNAKGTM